MAVRIGIGLFTGQVPIGSRTTFGREYRETVELVRLAESLGFDSVWVSEHHGASDGYLPSLMPMLAALAAATERIALGSGVVLAPLHDPLRLAEDAAVVDQLSGGRLILGLGIGWRQEEFRMFGVPIAERGRRTEETIAILRRAWSGARFSFEGRAFRYDRVRVTPPPAQDGGPPILLGGYADAAILRAGRVADGYITDDAGVREVHGYLALLERGARDAGRDPAPLRLALIRYVAIDDATGTARRGIHHRFGAYAAWDLGHDTPEHDSLEPPTPSDEELAMVAAGTPAHVTRALLRTVEAFGDRSLDLIVCPAHPGMSLEEASRAVETFARDVVPVLRGDPPRSPGGPAPA
ncbi:MAG TPA: LLM class flavin-dependent oxidoreductase [Actinomycetota bacterium]|nr:LLM class flavin-dependent oxidoreductase [Actinomycetota bacterium]